MLKKDGDHHHLSTDKKLFMILLTPSLLGNGVGEGFSEGTREGLGLEENFLEGEGETGLSPTILE